jgi:hypothetical protein
MYAAETLNFKLLQNLLYAFKLLNKFYQRRRKFSPIQRKAFNNTSRHSLNSCTIMLTREMRFLLLLLERYTHKSTYEKKAKDDGGGHKFIFS